MKSYNNDPRREQAEALLRDIACEIQITSPFGRELTSIKLEVEIYSPTDFPPKIKWSGYASSAGFSPDSDSPDEAMSGTFANAAKTMLAKAAELRNKADELEQQAAAFNYEPNH